ncbi:class I SAM-dependent methyltransferase [Mucilaginibacter sp. 14171R-50]|uniref:class I SAM-dependent methyltransferase n=1 Tax=Mucilaginibacter sp. 14171R-50 TaxID=2703789 RepID=UPI00138C2ED0|nr:class I SAM-dependent methyltransferase [Mucilaginibacter sp. 14171R-50]QHS54147.1 class I SAM-dependent methyltransferase [Mucilaginibacter sp. 14171R-50]
MANNLQQLYGNIDIYLFDQLLKGRFDGCTNVLDVGCGGGRNLVYFLQNGYEVYGIDPNPEAVALVKALAKELAPATPPTNFSIGKAEQLPFEDEMFDLIVCSAVLHFAADSNHFDAMLRSIWRALKTDGYFFARLASDIGIEDKVIPLGNSRYALPDGSERFLVNEQVLLEYTANLGGELFEPIKTTNVQNLRCMTTWCLRKAATPKSSAGDRTFPL